MCLFPFESLSEFLDDVVVHLFCTQVVLEDWGVHDEDDVKHRQLTSIDWARFPFNGGYCAILAFSVCLAGIITLRIWLLGLAPSSTLFALNLAPLPGAIFPNEDWPSQKA